MNAKNDTHPGLKQDLAAQVSELTERNADLEKLLREHPREQSRTWDISPDLFAVLNNAGYFEITNPAWQRVLGWSAEEIQSMRFNDFIHPDDAAVSNAAFEAIQNGVPILRFLNRYRQKDGGYCWLSWNAVPEGDKFYCTARDITDDKEQGAALERAEDALRQSQKLEAIGQLTGGVAHDFNNLLTVIRGSVDLLRRPDLSDEKRTRYIDAIGDTADRAAKLTGQLLAFARRQALVPTLFDAGQSLREVAGMVSTLTGSRIELDIKVPEHNYYIIADRSQFDTAIVNMGINARDAMHGEGRLTIATGPVSGIPAIRSHPPVPGDFIAVTVSDNGAGIPADLLDRIFEPFYTTKGVGEGTGLGLSQVIGFAKQSGGDIRADSIVGEGTTFTLYLPRAYPDRTDADAEDAEINLTGEGVCVLVVEDNEQVGAFAVDALKEIGYDSVLALDADRALVELSKDCGRFHIVFSDVVMPGTSGIELAEEIRRMYPDVPIVLTSGYSHVLAQNGQHGFELLHKPYSIEQLSRVLRKALAWVAKRRLSIQ